MVVARFSWNTMNLVKPAWQQRSCPKSCSTMDQYAAGAVVLYYISLKIVQMSGTEFHDSISSSQSLCSDSGLNLSTTTTLCSTTTWWRMMIGQSRSTFYDLNWIMVSSRSSFCVQFISALLLAERVMTEHWSGWKIAVQIWSGFF